ncbi:MAG: leucyl aminopeptidase [Gammaproteobacteria bacterium]|nr:leucyl aminopeptidase [Gammaproteobacteria bacterium]
MKYTTRTENPARMRTGCLVATRERAAQVGEELGVGEFVAHALEQNPKRVAVVPIPTDVRNLVAVPADGIGDDPGKYRKRVDEAVAALKGLAVRDAVWCLNEMPAPEPEPGVPADAHWKTRHALGALSAALYRYDEHKSKPSPDRGIARVAVLAEPGTRNAVRRAVRDGNALDAGMGLARDLANAPANVCTPQYLADAVSELAELENVSVEVLEEAQMEDLGMGAFLSVTRGSDIPAKLIAARYQGGSESDAPFVLVGKGVTFDTGGISLKPGAAMDEMKFDMCGAASVAGALRAAALANLPINVVAILAAAENMPSGKASRPGDIVSTMSGQTVEILNTDAEGRLLLCDALTFARRYEPCAVVDVATLTGACVIALGAHASALYANDEDLGRQLAAAGRVTSDRAWPMPLWDDYQEQLKSNFADMANIGGRPAGSITAACFLSRFADGLCWAHLDVAGTAWRSGARKGATGRPVPLLFQYLLDRAAEAPARAAGAASAP